MLSAGIFVDATTLTFASVFNTLPELTTSSGTGHGDTAAAAAVATLWKEMITANINMIAWNQKRREKLRSIELQNGNDSTL